MESIASFFKEEEDDILYQIGELKGEERKSALVVKNLLTKMDLPVEVIAEMAEVSIDFVLKIKASL